jgi:hypothetical protein
VLLRYVSEVYKTLIQTVPAPARTDEVEDIIAHLRAMLREVDSSLVDEWESLKAGRAGIGQAPGGPEAADEKTARAPELGDDPKALAARIRVDLHRLMRALAGRRYDEATAAVRAPAPGAEATEPAAGESEQERESEREQENVPWTAERFERALSPYWAEHASIAVTPFARRPSNTVIQPLGPRRWRAQQRLIDPEGDEDWTLDCIVDLTAAPGEPPRLESAPIIDLQRIGI